jgi:hypothetical protein
LVPHLWGSGTIVAAKLRAVATVLPVVSDNGFTSNAILTWRPIRAASQGITSRGQGESLSDCADAGEQRAHERRVIAQHCAGELDPRVAGRRDAGWRADDALALISELCVPKT